MIGSTDLYIYHFKISHGFLGKISSVDHMIKKKKGDDDNCFWMVPISSKNIIFSCVNVKKKSFFIRSVTPDCFLNVCPILNIKFWIFFF